MAYNVALHKSALMVQWLDAVLTERVDDASAYVTAHDLTDFAEFIGIPAEFLESLDEWSEDDFWGVASCAPSWIEPMDVDADGIYFYSEEMAEELSKMREIVESFDFDEILSGDW